MRVMRLSVNLRQSCSLGQLKEKDKICEVKVVMDLFDRTWIITSTVFSIAFPLRFKTNYIKNSTYLEAKMIQYKKTSKNQKMQEISEDIKNRLEVIKENDISKRIPMNNYLWNKTTTLDNS